MSLLQAVHEATPVVASVSSTLVVEQAVHVNVPPVLSHAWHPLCVIEHD